MNDLTRIGRHSDRAVHDRADIYAILDAGFVCHAAYIIEDRPVVIPTLYARDNDRVLLHGSNSSGLVRAVRNGSALSMGVTHVDGIVVARSGFNSSANYRSVVIHGIGSLLAGPEHGRALDVVVDWLIPGRVGDIRRPTEAELGQTSVIALGLDQVSAKVRTGGPKDDPADLDSGAWAGVIPMWLERGRPLPTGDLAEGTPVPDYLDPNRR